VSVCRPRRATRVITFGENSPAQTPSADGKCFCVQFDSEVPTHTHTFKGIDMVPILEASMQSEPLPTCAGSKRPSYILRKMHENELAL
jgi:hypothetical protein